MNAPETSSDYFVNHDRSGRFPWSLYHAPLERDLTEFVRSVYEKKPDAELLVLGCGLMHELVYFPKSARVTVLDIDARALEFVRNGKDPRIVGEILLEKETDIVNIPKRFDAIYAKEVIEHTIDPLTYLKGLHHLLNPHGKLWLSTPNYGEPWLPLFEKTALELIARMSGYTRKGMHPSPFSERSMAEALVNSGFRDPHVKATSLRLALVARATK